MCYYTTYTKPTRLPHNIHNRESVGHAEPWIRYHLTISATIKATQQPKGKEK
jgi:hypothetical protein